MTLQLSTRLDSGADQVASQGNSPFAHWLKAKGVEDPVEYLSNPEQPVELLVNLAHEAQSYRFRSDPVIQHLVRNPSLPRDVLLPMANRWAVAVSENPVFRLWQATEPGFLRATHHTVRRNLARAEGIDCRIIRELASDRSVTKSVRCGAATNPTTPLDMLVDYSERHAWQVRVALTLNPRLPVFLQLRLASDPRIEVRRALARREQTDAEALIVLSNESSDFAVQKSLLRNKSTPIPVLNKLLDVPHPLIRDGVMLRLASPDEFFEAQASSWTLLARALEVFHDDE